MAVTPNSIVTPQAPRTANAVCTAANADYDDSPATSVLLVTAGANGSRLTRLSAIARATVTATELQLYRSTDGGATIRFFRSVAMSAYTVVQTMGNTPTDFGYSDANPIMLAANERLYVSIGVSLAGGIVFTAELADY